MWQNLFTNWLVTAGGLHRMLAKTFSNPTHSHTCLEVKMWSGIATILPKATWVGRTSAVDWEELLGMEFAKAVHNPGLTI